MPRSRCGRTRRSCLTVWLWFECRSGHREGSSSHGAALARLRSEYSVVKVSGRHSHRRVSSGCAISEQASRPGQAGKQSPGTCATGHLCVGPAGLGERNALQRKRGGKNNAPPNKLTWRSTFSHCGELVRHYPVCGWFRVATALAKREANRVVPVGRAYSRQQDTGASRRVGARDDKERPSPSSVRCARQCGQSMSGRKRACPYSCAELGNTVVEDGGWPHPSDAPDASMA
ncbi:hypothetical protein M514_05814 [Trichuris suis]|uniref:DUF7047 domain-containing protein n=1 Tax=Trichuris suis TaxID=68888 RepID=A0A085M7Y7_9BILA|nr:hypothetical protein M513_05814 [Trichuris suis]KFD66426.1 hypothetical protein M514_05814 [Trichuris suis]